MILGEIDHPGRVDPREPHDLRAGRSGDRLGRRARFDPLECGLDRLALAGIAFQGALELAFAGHVAVGLDVARPPAIGVMMYPDCGESSWVAAPQFTPSMHYAHGGKFGSVRLYRNVDQRYIQEDFFAKLARFSRGVREFARFDG